MPAKVVRMADGSVACVWRYEDNVVAVTRHLGTQSLLLGKCAGEIPDSGMNVTPLADSQNRLWITGEFPKIYRADGKGGVTMVHEITPAELKNPGNAREGYNKIHAVEDGEKRIWVWSDPEASNWASLRGVLLFTDDKVEYRDPMPGVKGVRILTIARADDRHMWIAVANDGLYKLDIDTFTLERSPDPSPKALCCVNEIHVDGSAVYAIEDLPRLQDALWRLRDGAWTQIVASFDVHSNSWMPRSWLPIKEGLLIESFGHGPWFVPKKGSAALFSWESGFPFEDVHSLCQLVDGTFWGISGDQIFHGPLSFPPRVRENPRIVPIEPDQGWVVAATGHIWMISRDPPLLLKEWDGFKWIPHPLPAGTKFAAGLNEDDQGRLWLYSQGVLLFDPRTSQWQTFPKLDAAFVAFKDKPVHFLHDTNFLTAQYNADRRRIAYRQGVTEINYYDGTAWHRWERRNIVGKEEGDGAVGPPWFDDNGKLHVNIRNKMSWQRDDAGKWSEIPYVSHFPGDIWSEGHDNDEHPVPPDGAITNKPESIVVDNLGTTWMTWQGDIYKCIPGFCAKVFSPDEINPFHAKRYLRSAFVDAQGNAFLQAASSGLDRLMIRPKAAAPVTHIAMTSSGQDLFVAHLDAQTKEPVTFRWSLDDGAWQMITIDSINLDHLPNGAHVLKVTAIDDQLNMDTTPVTARFETKVDPTRQIDSLVAQLNDPDYDQRQAAVTALAEQPAAALPFLRKARATADDNQRWWIDAAIQECERRSAEGAKQSGP
jgi:hypothetical protein